MTHVGHVAVFVSDLARSRTFYEDVLGMRHSETHRPGDHPMLDNFNESICFLSFGEYHHDVVLVHQSDEDGNTMPVEGHTLMHLAFALDADTTTAAFADHLREQGVEPMYGPIRHESTEDGDGTWGGNVSVYFEDPDGHLLEAYTEMQAYTGDRQAAAATQA